MISKNILLLLFVLLFIVKANVALAVEEEEDEISSNDKFEEIIMTSTAPPPKSLPTISGSKTLPTITATKTLPIQTTGPIIENEDGASMKETVYTMHDGIYYYEGTTTIPADIDDVFVTCSIRGYNPYVETSTLRYLCDYDNGCYIFKNHFNFTLPSSTSTYKCNFFTKRSNDPQPTNTDEGYTTSLCTPEVSTFISTLKSRVSTVLAETIPDKEQTNLVTIHRSLVTSLSTKKIVIPTLTHCSRKKPKPTIINTPKPKPYDNYKYEVDEELDDERKIIITTDFYDKITTSPVMLPSNVNDYAIDCTRSLSYPPKIIYTKPPKGLQRRSISSSLPSKSLKISSKIISTSSKVIPSNTITDPNRTTKLPKSTPTPGNFYCQKDDYCFGYYTKIVGVEVSGMYKTFTTCSIYTHDMNEPTRTEPYTNYKLSLCRPTQTLYKSVYTDLLFIYGTTITEGNYITEDEYYVYSTYDVLKKTIKCKSYDDIPPTITAPPIPITITTTPSPSPSPITPPTKCLPVIVTVTEKEKITITEKETVTVTVTEEEEEQKDNSKCAMKWAQCGGQDYKGPTCCQAGSTCHEINKYYSQCI